MFTERDDLPSAPGLENLGPLGSLALHDGAVVRVPFAGNPFEPRPPVPVDDPAVLREAARLISAGLVLRERHNHGAQGALMATWVEGALGPPCAVRSIGRSEQLIWFEGAIVLLLRDALTVACATSERLRALLAHPLPRGLSPAPARYSYGSIAGVPPRGPLLGSVDHTDRYFPEAFELYETATGCWVRGVLDGAFETQFHMTAGGSIATVPRHPHRFAGASSFGEWQPGLRNRDGLRAQLERYRASEALANTVFAVDELVGGFRGQHAVRRRCCPTDSVSAETSLTLQRRSSWMGMPSGSSRSAAFSECPDACPACWTCWPSQNASGRGGSDAEIVCRTNRVAGMTPGVFGGTGQNNDWGPI